MSEFNYAAYQLHLKYHEKQPDPMGCSWCLEFQCGLAAAGRKS